MAGDLVGEGGRAQKAPVEKCVTRQRGDRDEGRMAGGIVETPGNGSVKVKEVPASNEIESGKGEQLEVEAGKEGREKKKPEGKPQPRDDEACCGSKVEQGPVALLLPLHLRGTWTQTCRGFWRRGS